MEIKDKVIIVTGASQGIGLATARLLSIAGAQVVLAARSGELLKKYEKELDNSFAIEIDMRKPEDIKKLIDTTIEKFGRIDLFINNAGQGMYGPVEKIDIEKYKEIMELNVYAPLRAMEMIIPIMRTQGGGMILNISSRVSKNYFPNLAAYASTKYALNALSLTARTELSKDNIVVSVFHPKMTATNFGKNAIRIEAPQSSAGARPGDRPGIEVDSAEAVAEGIIEQIKSESPEAEM
jgi:short-subunit dehydrogenase